MKRNASLARTLSAIALATIVGFVVGGGAPARAANGQSLLLGQQNTETTETTLVNTASASTGFVAQGAINGIDGFGSVNGLSGSSQNGTGVRGTSSGGIGVWGDTASVGGIGVKGSSGDSNAKGIYGLGQNGGFGIFGDAFSGATALYGQAGSTNGAATNSLLNNGTALRTLGVTLFRRSGVSTVPGTSISSRRSVTVSNVYLTAASIVLATIQNGNLNDVWVQRVATNTSGKSITIWLSKSVTQSVRIGWFIVN